ncbi:syntaxin binding protein 6 (amisyn), like isoform X2 [Pungitius pungitius]|uniref:syntaxin binding protein 6 (amisyn), like isoform X2 n=1 Tax=Pungitius pungitius TaxID=134920 RepID=UPI002E0F7264
MTIQSAINKELFIPRDERLLVAVEVRRRKRKRVSFLPTGAKGDYVTFICVSVTNTRPHQLLIIKVKQFGSSSFTRRSEWTVEQLRHVNGINPNKDSPEFDLVFDNAMDQWVASSSAEKCIFVQILYHACQTYWEGKAGRLGKVGHQGRASQCAHRNVGYGPGDSSPVSASRPLQVRQQSDIPPRKTEFVNCQSKLTGGQPGPGDTRSTMGNVVHRVNVLVGQRGEGLTRAEDKTVKLMHKAQQFADIVHKMALK